MLLSLPLEGAALLLERAPGRDMSVSWEEQDPEPDVEASCGRTLIFHLCGTAFPQISL